MITLWVMGVATASLIGYGMYWRRDTVHRWRRTIKALAAKCGLTAHLDDDWAWMDGTIRAVPIRVEISHESDAPGVSYWTVISANPPIPPQISFLPRLDDDDPPAIGQPEFDYHVAVSPLPEARAVLDPTTRTLIMDVIAAKGRIENGRIHFRFMDAIPSDRIEPLLWLMATLSERLMTPSEEHLAHLAIHAELNRADAAFSLLAHSPRRPALLRTTLSKKRGQWVLMAARHMGAGAIPAVQAEIERRQTTNAVRLEGLAWLAEQDRAMAAELSLTVLYSDALAQYALALHAGGTPPALAVLGQIVENWPEAGVKALQVARQHGAAAIPLMQKHLASKVPAEACAAAAGLGFIGDPAVVPGLIEARDRGHRAVRSAAQAAIAAIQDRTRLSAGGLAVIDAGGLSEVGDH